MAVKKKTVAKPKSKKVQKKEVKTTSKKKKVPPKKNKKKTLIKSTFKLATTKAAIEKERKEIIKLFSGIKKKR
jgi:hypothetical protein